MVGMQKRQKHFFSLHYLLSFHFQIATKNNTLDVRKTRIFVRDPCNRSCWATSKVLPWTRTIFHSNKDFLISKVMQMNAKENCYSVPSLEIFHKTARSKASLFGNRMMRTLRVLCLVTCTWTVRIHLFRAQIPAFSRATTEDHWTFPRQIGQ